MGGTDYYRPGQLYRLTYTEDATAHILLNLGGYVATSTMVNAHVNKTSSNELTGYFDTKGRLWGGPDVVRIYFAVCFDKPFESLDGWADKECFPDIEELQGTTESTPRSDSGWSYHDAPTSGVSAQYQVRRGEQVCLKMAVSYVSIANAKRIWKRSATIGILIKSAGIHKRNGTNGLER